MTHTEALRIAIALIYAQERLLAADKSANLINPEVSQDRAAEYDRLVDAHAVLVDIASLPYDPRQRALL